MKKIFAVIVGLIMVATILPAQTPNLQGGGAGTKIYRVQNWSPFTADSIQSAFTTPLDVSDFDSLYFFVKTSSVNGTPSFHAALQLGMVNTTTTAYWDSVANVVDTTTAKLETFKYADSQPTRGAAYVRLKLMGSAAVSTENKADAIVNLWIVGRKRVVLPGQ